MSQEGEDPEIDMSDDPYHCVEALSKYLYTFDYDTPEKIDGVNLHTHLCIFADKVGALSKATNVSRAGINRGCSTGSWS